MNMTYGVNHSQQKHFKSHKQAHKSSMKALRIGFLLQNDHCPQWQYDILQRIEKDQNLSIQMIAFNGESQLKGAHLKGASSQKNATLCQNNNKQSNKQSNSKQANFIIGSIFSRIERLVRIGFSILNPFAYGLANIYHRIDEKYNRQAQDLWSEMPINSLGSFNDATIITINPIRKKFSHYFRDDDLATINNLKLDVIIRFGFSIVRGDIHSVAQHGIWSFHHGDNRLYRGGPPGIWELVKGEKSISVTLQLLSDVLDCGNTIARSTHRCCAYSAYNNKKIIYAACGDLLLQKLRQTQSMGFEVIQKNALFNEEIPKTTILKSPRNFEFFPLFFQLAKTFINFRWPRNKKIQWYLATKKQDNDLTSFNNSHIILPPLDRFYADPFLATHNEKHYVFFEELIYKNVNAHISVGELVNGELLNIKPIIEETFHLSYPFIFKDNETWFLIPEGRQDKSVRLYECTDFPYQWKLKKKILNNVELLDPTIHKKDDTYFLFANQYDPKRNTSNELLVVYFSKSLEGDWQAHPLNPLVINICNSRPAGKFFTQGKKLIMPTQNCALRYGSSTNFNEIDITESHFSMKKIATLSPSWKQQNLGSHTWNEDSGTVITDGHHYIDR